MDDQEDSLSSSVTAKRRGVPSSVPIAAAITAYARIELSEYLNISGNECIYSDTDSVVLKNALDSEHVGKGLGQMKLEYKIDHGIFISPKTYGLKYKDPVYGEIKFKLVAKGIGGDKMSFDDYEKLLAGQDVVKEKTYFQPLPELGTVRVYTQPITIRGVKPKYPALSAPSGSTISSEPHS